ncbi:unnamed protein product [Lepidochelys olivacea]
MHPATQTPYPPHRAQRAPIPSHTAASPSPRPSYVHPPPPRHPAEPCPRPAPMRPPCGGVPGRPAGPPALPNRKSWLGWALRREPRRRVPGEVELFFTSEEINFHIRKTPIFRDI